MNNLALFPFDDESEQLALGQGYNYEILEEDTRDFVLQKTDETHGLLKRTAQNIIKIGLNLKAVKERLPHGHYLPWLKAEFEMSERQALNFTRVATRFETKSAIIADLSPTIIYELAAPSTSDEVIEGVISGAIDPTLEAIRAEKEEEKRRADDEAKLRKEVQQELALFKDETKKEKEAKQKELDIKEKELELFKWEKELEVSKYEIDQKKLNEDIKSLKEEKEKIEKSKERTIQQDTPATKAKLEQMDKDIKALEDKGKKLKDEREKREKELKEDLDKSIQQRDRLLKENEKLEKQVQEYLFRDTEQKRKEEVKLRLRQHNEAIRMGINQASARAVSPIDASQYFDPADWEELDQTIADLKRWTDKCIKLKESITSQFIDASPVFEAPLIYIEG